MNRTRFSYIVIIVILIIVVIFYAVNPLYAPFKTIELPHLAGTFGALFIIVLLIERVTEIFISLTRSTKADQLKLAVDSFSEDDRKTKEKEFKEAENALSTYKSATKKSAMTAGFVLAVLICAAGVGFLSEVIDLDQIKINDQESFIRGMDIILTAGLISGGSDAFHQFVTTVEAYFKDSKRRSEKD